jgi:hypothetical protein
MANALRFSRRRPSRRLACVWLGVSDTRQRIALGPAGSRTDRRPLRRPRQVERRPRREGCRRCRRGVFARTAGRAKRVQRSSGGWRSGRRRSVGGGRGRSARGRVRCGPPPTVECSWERRARVATGGASGSVRTSRETHPAAAGDRGGEPHPVRLRVAAPRARPCARARFRAHSPCVVRLDDAPPPLRRSLRSRSRPSPATSAACRRSARLQARSLVCLRRTRWCGTAVERRCLARQRPSASARGACTSAVGLRLDRCRSLPARAVPPTSPCRIADP